MIEYIIERFLKESEQAQLLLTTHNDGLLGEKDLLRKDNIWFTEKNADGSSVLYPLTDFKGYSISPRLFENNSIEKIEKNIKELLDEDVFAICVLDADVSRHFDAEHRKMTALKNKYENNANVILCLIGFTPASR